MSDFPRLPLDLSGLDQQPNSMSSTLLRFAMYGVEFLPSKVTYANMVKVDVFDSEEEHQAAYEHFKFQVERITDPSIETFIHELLLNDLNSGRLE